MKKILIHGLGHRADSWTKVIEYMNNDKDMLCPNLDIILNGKEASYTNLYSSFAEYCNKIDGKIDLCGLSLGGILALNYAIDYPEKSAYYLSKNIKNSKLKIIENTGHIVNEENPKELSRVISEFWK